MITGKCTCDGSGFGGKTMKELLVDDKIYYGGLTLEELGFKIFPKGITDYCTRTFEDGDCLAKDQCIGCMDPPERFKKMTTPMDFKCCDKNEKGLGHDENCALNQKQQESSKKREEMDKKIREMEETLDKAKYPAEVDYPYKLYPSSYGWVCPVCGRGNAPFTPTCPCKDSKYEVTC